MDTARTVIDELGLRSEQSYYIAQVMLEALKLFDRKQLDYGPGNIARFGEVGLLVRQHDKIERLAHLYEVGGDPQNEPTDDTWIDMLVYAAIALVWRKGQWLGQQRMLGRPLSEVLAKVTEHTVGVPKPLFTPEQIEIIRQSEMRAEANLKDAELGRA